MNFAYLRWSFTEELKFIRGSSQISLFSEATIHIHFSLACPPETHTQAGEFCKLSSFRSLYCFRDLKTWWSNETFIPGTWAHFLILVIILLAPCVLWELFSPSILHNLTFTAFKPYFPFHCIELFESKNKSCTGPRYSYTFLACKAKGFNFHYTQLVTSIICEQAGVSAVICRTLTSNTFIHVRDTSNTG